jgi:hypothetical protein
MDQTDPPLDVHLLYGDRHRQYHRLIAGTTKAAASRLDNLFAVAPALLTSVHRSVLVRAAIYGEVAQRAPHLILFSGVERKHNLGLSPRSGRKHKAWGGARLCERNPRIVPQNGD